VFAFLVSTIQEVQYAKTALRPSVAVRHVTLPQTAKVACRVVQP